MVFQHDHERLMQSNVDDRAEKPTIEIDTRLAPRIVMAEIGGARTPKRMPDNSDVLQVEAPREGTRRIRIELHEPVDHESHILAPHSCKPSRQGDRRRACLEVEVGPRGTQCDSPIGEATTVVR